MNINGVNYGLKMTVGAEVEISRICPNGDISRLGEAVTGAFDETVDAIAHIIVAMSNGYEKQKAYRDRTYTANPVTFDEVRNYIEVLEQDEFAQMQEELKVAMDEGMKPSIDAEPVKKKN